jgi:hypothetical protein
MRTLRLLVCLVLSSLVGCGGGGGGGTVTRPPLTVTPGTVRTVAGAQPTVFTANEAVIWTVNEGSVGGSISAQGAYTPPALATDRATYHITATSQADASRLAYAEVIVDPNMGHAVIGAQ